MLICCFAIKTTAQNNAIPKKDTIKAWEVKYNPILAPVFSAILPGGGQVYNHKYWKVPIVYAGFYGLFYSWNRNQKKYKQFYYTSVSFPFQGNNIAYAYNGYLYTKDQLDASTDFYRRYRNISLIGIFGWYTLNIIDASIDAYTAQLDLFGAGKRHNPQRAAVLSAAIPGLGQIYNKKYLKAPLVYALAGGLFYGWKFNNDYFTLFNDVYKNIPTNASLDSVYIIEGGFYLKDNVYKAQEYYRRWKDLSLIGFGFLYMLNIIDATVDAYMFNYDITNDLSFNLQPDFIDVNSIYYGQNYPIGLRMTLRF